MSEEKHNRLEQLKELLNFKDDGFFAQYCNGYKQAEIDLKPKIKRLTEALEWYRDASCSQRGADGDLARKALW